MPLLLLCTARPELYERHPNWAAGLRNATAINLAPLTDKETAQLISTLLERAVLPAETQQALLERAGGNPLYAEEFARLLSDRGDLGDAVEVPDSVQALIAARLDTLTQERKSLLQDAAVMGKVFWAGTLVDMGGREPREVEVACTSWHARSLCARPGRRRWRARPSTASGTCSCGTSATARSRAPLALRATVPRQHGWRRRRAGGSSDLADVLAHHYVQALELTRAAGQTEEREELEARAIRYLALSGGRALPLDVTRAETHLGKALELAPAAYPERPLLLERWAQAALQQGRLQEAKEALEEALAVYREREESVAAGRVLTALSTVLWRQGDPREEEAVAEAVALLEAQPHGPELVAAYAEFAGTRMLHGAYPEGAVAAQRALELAAELGLAEQARALGFLGSSRSFFGDRQGLDDMRRALELAVEQGEGRTAAVLHNNLAEAMWLYEGPQAAIAIGREGIDFCERRGIAEFTLAIAAISTRFRAETGHAAQALAEAAPLAERLQAAGDIWFTEPRAVQLHLIAESGASEQHPDAVDLVVRSRDSGAPELIAHAFAAAAQLLLVQGRPNEAQALLVELQQVPKLRSTFVYPSVLPRLLRTALAIGAPELAARLVDGVEPTTPLADHALCACRAQLEEAAGEHAQAAATFAEAAERWREFGNVPERGYALLGQGRCLSVLGQPEAEQPLREARELFASMGYKPALAETEALLDESEAAAS